MNIHIIVHIYNNLRLAKPCAQQRHYCKVNFYEVRCALALEYIHHKHKISEIYTYVYLN